MMAAKVVDDPLEAAIAAEMAAKFSVLSTEEIEAARKTARDRVEAQGKKKAINDIIEPVRQHFEKPGPKALLKQVRSFKVTR